MKSLLQSAASAVTLFVAIFLISILSPSIYLTTLRAYAQPKIISVYGSKVDKREYHGTGFYVTAPSGKTYMLTNNHICLDSDDGYLYSQTQRRGVKLKILAHYSLNDLCLLTVPPNSPTGLRVSSSIDINDAITVMGRPSKGFFTITQGQILARNTTTLVTGLVVDDPLKVPKWLGSIIQKSNLDYGLITPKQCALPYMNIKDLTPLLPLSMRKGLTLGTCVSFSASWTTNIVILPGHSGSPVLNLFGEVIAVAFATSTSYHWGELVPLDDVQKFLSQY